MMSNKEDTVRVKEEPKDTWPVADDDRVFDSEDSCEVKNLEAFPLYISPENHMNEAMSLGEKLDEEIFIDCEWKDVKPEPKPLSTIICKTEHHSSLPIVKTESQIQTNYWNEKRLTVLIKKEFDYENKRPFQEKPRLKVDRSKEMKIFQKNTKTKLPIENKKCIKTYKGKMIPKRQINVAYKSITCEIFHESFSRKHHRENHINAIQTLSPSLQCDICHKSFGTKSHLKRHVSVVHNRSKPFECDICQKLFGLKSDLTRHISAVHNRNKPFECEICHKSFGQKITLKSHINALHYRNKPFECRICHKSFGYQNLLKNHKMTIHDHSKPFECDICHKLFGLKCNLKSHVNTVHDRSKPFECNICQKSFGYKSVLITHINSVHDRSKSFECEICHKSFGYPSYLKRHMKQGHNKRPFQCDICKKSYGRKDHLKTHIIMQYIIGANPSNVKLATNHLDKNNTYKDI